MTRSQVAKLVAVLIASYPHNRVVPERPATANSPEIPGTSSAYESMLADLDYETTNAAVGQLIAASPQYMPTIGAIRGRVIALSQGEVRAGGEAWESVRKAISRAGRNRTPGVDFEFSDPVTAQAVRSLGWLELCDSEFATADRARFIELYDALAVKHRRAQISEGLPSMQRFRALQAARSGEARTLAQLLPPVDGGEA